MIAEKNKFENIIDILAKILLVLVFAVYIAVWAVVQKDFLVAHIVGFAAAVAMVAAVYLVSQLITKDMQAVALLTVGG
ncbi:MAG: hypothetical protein IJW74_06790, partial [Oscillospiraceae bacterium]|nr:hypothetical protein [Oscillospiraceae bacterium]